jgi:hypothetical protein
VALITPTVTVGLSFNSKSPKGFPRAITHSPIIISSEFPGGYKEDSLHQFLAGIYLIPDQFRLFQRK